MILEENDSLHMFQKHTVFVIVILVILFLCIDQLEIQKVFIKYD